MSLLYRRYVPDSRTKQGVLGSGNLTVYVKFVSDQPLLYGNENLKI